MPVCIMMYATNVLDDLQLLERLDYLIRAKATGTSSDLASRLKVSRRKIERLIAGLRDMGLPVSYDKEAGTYYYTDEVHLHFEIAVGGDCLFKVKGGTKKII